MPIHNPFTNTADMPSPQDYSWPNPILSAPLFKTVMDKYRADLYAWRDKHGISPALLQQYIDEMVAASKTNPEEIKSWWQRAKDKVQQTLSNASNNISNAWHNSALGQAAMNVQDKLGDMIKTGRNMLALSLLGPFRPVMVMALKRKGFNTSSGDSLLKITQMFYDIVIKNRNTYDLEFYDTLNHLNADTQDVLIKGGSLAAGAATGVPPQAIDAMVRAVLEFIKRLKDKKEKGEQLTPEESRILREAEEAAKAPPATENVKKDWSGILKVAAFALAVFGLWRIFKR